MSRDCNLANKRGYSKRETDDSFIHRDWWVFRLADKRKHRITRRENFENEESSRMEASGACYSEIRSARASFEPTSSSQVKVVIAGIQVGRGVLLYATQGIYGCDRTFGWRPIIARALYVTVDNN